MRSFAPALRMVITLLTLALLWQAAAALVSRPMLPPPGEVAAALVSELAEGTLARHLGISAARVAGAAASAFLPALVLGMAAGLSGTADRILSPAAYILAPIPKTALLPVILLFLGLGNASKVFLVALILFFPMYLAVRDECRGLDSSWFDSLKTLGAGGGGIIRHGVLPAILPRIWSVLRTSAGTAFAVLFMAETFATREGIGWYIMDAWTRIDYVRMYAGIAALALAGLVITAAIDLADRLTCPWAVPEQGRGN